MRHEDPTPEEQNELDRLYADWLRDQRSNARPGSYTEELTRSIVAYLKRNRGAVLTLQTIAGGAATLLAIYGHAPFEVQGALAALSALATVSGALRLLKWDKKKKRRRTVNQDAQVDWSPYEKD